MAKRTPKAVQVINRLLTGTTRTPGISQRAMAKRLRTSQTTVSLIANQKLEPCERTQKRINRVLGLKEGDWS